jgi:hypothetical protein
VLSAAAPHPPRLVRPPPPRYKRERDAAAKLLAAIGGHR